MKKNISTFIYLVIVFAIAIACYFGFSESKKSRNNNSIAQEQNTKKTFSVDNANLMMVDTFTALVKKAYGSLANVSIDANYVNVSMNQAGQITKDFFNGNDALLQCNIREHGFVIEYNTTQKTMIANFVIKNGGVTVPNDVLIKLMDKIYNATKANK